MFAETMKPGDLLTIERNYKADFEFFKSFDGREYLTGKIKTILHVSVRKDNFLKNLVLCLITMDDGAIVIAELYDATFNEW